MIDGIGSPGNGAVLAASARLMSLTSQRIGRKHKALLEGKVRTLVAKCRRFGLDPVRVIDATYNDMDAHACVKIFGMSYPPIEYVSSDKNLNRVSSQWGANVAKREKRVNDIERSESYAKKNRSGPVGLYSLYMSGDVSDQWVRMVKEDPNHVCHGEVMEMAKLFEETNGD